MTTENSKVTFNRRNIAIFTVAGTLGGASVGYHAGNVCAANLYMDELFPDVTIQDKSVT